MRTLILGFDAFDPKVFERLSSAGKLPHLTEVAEGGGYRRFGVANPPQSEVSWTSIATGLNPGGHGIFDFVHRDPATYALNVSLLPTERGFGGTRFAPPFRAHTIFDQAVRQGYPATALWWPATFPARLESPVRTLPGLGTPDIQGRLGVGTLFLTDVESEEEKRKTAVERLDGRRGAGRYSGVLRGPVQKKRSGVQESTVEVQLDLTGEHTARLVLGKQALPSAGAVPVELVEGVWSPILEVPFKLGPFASVRALTRAILTQVHPDIRLYFLPLQIHPLHSAWRYATPQAFVKDTWRSCGPFLTLGWQQDTTALEEGCISDAQFFDLCDSILQVRERILMYQLDRFREGILASVHDSLDRIQHMFWRGQPGLVDQWYVKLDGLLDRVQQRLLQLGGSQCKVVVVSDHGFADFEYKVHLNRWLIEQGILTERPVEHRRGSAGEAETSGSLKDVDWSRTRAYAVGLNSIYVNKEGREGQGIVPPGEYEALVGRLRDQLTSWRGPDGRRVVQRALRQNEAFEGPYTPYGPDLVVGYSPGYRASPETGLGQWKGTSLEQNEDHWGGDHCMDAEAVPGVVFCNEGLREFPSPTYRDFPALTIGAEPEVADAAPPPQAFSEEDEAVVEERLRGLGYL